MGKIRPESLQKHWVHSHEEDTDTEMVFRPAGSNFPPSRGRTSFELKPDGGLVQRGIAPDDRRQESRGVWKLENDGSLCFYTGSALQPSRVMRIASIESNRLVIKK
jgi:hypothetical protein